MGVQHEIHSAFVSDCTFGRCVPTHENFVVPQPEFTAPVVSAVFVAETVRARTVRVRVAYVERSTGPLVLGPPKSRAGRRVVGIPAAIVPDLESHLAKFVKPEAGALVFPGIMGGPVRRGNFNKLSGWAHSVEAIGMPGLHFHDLRHTGNQFAANSGAGLRDLMTRMGHDSERAAMIYQHEARGADKAITDAIDKHVGDERGQDDDEGDDGPAGVPVPA
jgi:integrase